MSWSVDILYMDLISVVPVFLAEHVLIDVYSGVPYILVRGLIECRRGYATVATPDITVLRDYILA